MSDATVIEIERRDDVCIVRLNRPDALNAANAALHARLATVWDEIVADKQTRAVVLTGNGRAFCAGGDLDMLDRMASDSDFRAKVMREAAQIVERLVRFPLPIIAAVNGPAVGLGCSLAALCDVVLAEQSSYFADPHVSVGLVAADGGALLWPSLMSLLRAKEYLFTGDRIPASLAVDLGLANRVVADGTSCAEALTLAARMAAQPPMALQETKRALNKQLERSMLEVLDFALGAEAATMQTPEFRARVADMRSRV